MEKEKKGKKIAAVSLAAALIVVILLCLVRCQSGGGEADPTETAGVATATTETAGEPTSEATEGIEPTTEPTEVTEEPTEEPTEAPTEEPTKPTENAVEPTEHVHEYSEKVVEATCTERGYTVYSCQCGDTYNDNYTDALGHNWCSWVVAREATEAATGLEERSCGRCGAKESRETPKVVPNHTHKYTAKETKKATCTVGGVMTYTCSCGDTYTEGIPALGHSYTSVVTAPTCTAKGYTTHTCSRCRDTYKDSYINATGHSYTEKVTKAATCKEAGVKTYTCSKCKDSYTKSIDKVAHKYVDTVTKPTCTKDGYTVSKCSVCGDTKTTAGAKATGHSYKAVVTAPTYTAGGYTTYTCKVCGYSYRGNETPKLEPEPTKPTPTEPVHQHSYTGKVTTAPTCTKDGVKTYICVCGDVSKTETIPATGHSYSVTSQKAATCAEAGYKVYTCSKCSDSYTESVTADHNWVHHHKDEVGHNEVYYVCHCGWSVSDTTISNSGYNAVAYIYMFHMKQFEGTDSEWDHSYYTSSRWVVDIPGYDYYECSGCGKRK